MKSNIRAVSTVKLKSRKQIIKELDKLWAEVVKLRDKGLCIICGNAGVQSHHLFSRRNLSVRHDSRNGVLLCKYHHIFGVHVEYEKYRDVLINHVGEREFEALKIRASMVVKFGKADLEAIRLSLLQEKAELLKKSRD